MIEQQFLTTLTTINRNQTSKHTSHSPQRHSNLILDYINATYQGYLTSIKSLPLINIKNAGSGLGLSKSKLSTNNYVSVSVHGREPQGIGIFVDDQFNFIMAQKWSHGKINGHVFIKLANQITIWGQWANNRPKGLSCIKVGAYTLYNPNPEPSNQLRRPKKLLAFNTQKNKAYIIISQKYPQSSNNKRQYSIIIQKIIPLASSFNVASSLPSYPRQTIQKIRDLALDIDFNIEKHQVCAIDYLEYLSQERNCINVVDKNNGIFVTGKFQEHKIGTLLGLLLDKKKLSTKAMGSFTNKKQDKMAELSGIGHCKTAQNQSITGIFKDNMLIRQFTQQPNSPNPLQLPKLCSPSIKQQLYHEHMKNFKYQHNFIYFSEIKKINNYCIQVYKYIEMFQRLANNRGGINGLESDSSSEVYQGNGEHPVNKYDKEMYQNYVQGKQQESSGSSIIDQFPQFKVNLKTNIYRETDMPQKSHILINDQNGHKKPGFIMSRNNKIYTQTRNLQTRNLQNKNRISRSPSKSPQINIRLNKKLQVRRSPIKTQTKWKM